MWESSHVAGTEETEDVCLHMQSDNISQHDLICPPLCGDNGTSFELSIISV